MALYEVQGPDGVVYEVEGPEGASDSQLINALQMHLGSTSVSPVPTPVSSPTSKRKTFEELKQEELDKIRSRRIIEPEDTGFFENLALGTGAGFVGTGESIALGAATVLEEEAETEARKKIQEAFEQYTPEGGDKDSFAYGLGSALGSIGGFGLGSAAIAGTAGLAGLSAPAAAVAGGLGVAALGVGASRGEQSERARAAGASVEEREDAVNSVLINIAGASEAIPLTRLFRTVDIPMLGKVIDNIGPKKTEGIGATLYNAGLTGGIEGIQEVGQQIAQNLTEQEYNALAKTFEGTGESFTYASIAAGLLDLFFGRRKRADITRDDASTDPLSSFTKDEDIEGLLPAPSDDILVSPTGEAFTREQEEEVRRSQERSRREQEAEDEITLGDMPSAAVRIPREQRDLFPEELEQAERTSPTEISDVEIADAMAERAAEEERTRRIEDDDQIKEQPDVIDEVRYSDFQDRTIAERTAAEDIELAEMQRQEDAAKEADDLEIQRMVIADEDKAGLQDIEAQIKERRPSDPQQPALKDVQRKQRTRRRPQTLADTVAEPRTLDSAPEIADVGKILKDANISEATQALIPDSLKTKPKQRLNATDTGDVFTPPRKTPKKATTPKQVKTEVEAPVDISSDIRGSIEFPTAVPRGAEFTNPNDVTAINTLLNKKIPRDEKGVEQTAQTYLKRFKRPADAFTAIAFEIAENTPKFRAQKDTPTSEKAKFAGTGGFNTKATLQWIENNLSPDAKTEIDRRIVEQQKESTKVEKDVTTRAKQEQEGTKIKQRDTKTAIAVDSATDGKAKVVGTSKPKKKAERVVKETPRAERKLSKEEQELARVAEIVERVQGKRGKNAKPALDRTMPPAKLKEKLATDTQKFLDAGGEIDVLNLKVTPETIVELDSDIPKSVITLLRSGDIKGALEELAKVSTDKRVKQIAKALANNMGTTKIKIGKLGEDTLGQFDPKNNTITLDSTNGMTIHTLLHEATHAATMSVLSNKGHPVTKQLQKLYDSVLPLLDTTYGATNLEEFVAEVFSNPTFQHRLSQITTKGESISALQKFLRVITNFIRSLIGMDTKPVDSALDSADASIEAILYPSPETRNIGAFYNLTPKGIQKILDKVVEGGRSLSKNIKERKELSASGKRSFFNQFLDFLSGTSPDIAKNLLLGFSNTLVLGEVAREAGFKNLVIDMHEAFLRGRRRIAKSNEEVYKLLEKVDGLLASENKLKGLLNKIALSTEYGATIYQVDPRLTETEATKRYGKDPEKMRVWKAQRGDWNALGEKGQEAYILLQEHYKKKYEELKATINGELENLMLASESKDSTPTEQQKANVKAATDSLKTQVYNKLFESAELEVYFPLVREGDYKLSYRVKEPAIKGGTDYVVLMFGSEKERKVAEAALKKESNVINSSIEKQDPETQLYKAFDKAPSSSFVAQTLQILNANNISKDTQSQVLKLFVESLPQTSFAKSLQKRQNIEGFIPDVFDGVRIKGISLGHQIARLQTNNELKRIYQSIEDTAWQESNPVPEKEFNRLKLEVGRRVNFAIMGAKNKNIENYARLANQIAFLYTIATNPSSAIIQTAQVPMIVYPLLGARYGYGKAEEAVREGARLAMGSADYISPKMDDNYNVSDTGEFTVKKEVIEKIRKAFKGRPKKADRIIAEIENLIPLVKASLEYSALHRGYVADQLNLDEYVSKPSPKGLALKERGESTLNYITSKGAIPFTAADKFNRQTTLIATYNLVLKDMNDSKAAGKKYYSHREGKMMTVPATRSEAMRQAARDANHFADRSNGGTVIETGARYAQQDLRRVAMMYKNYGLAMNYLMIRSIFRSLDGQVDAKARRVAAKQILGITLASIFFAGVRGAPFIGMAILIADQFLEPDEEDAETIMRKTLGEMAYKGPVSYITGVDVSTRLKLNDLFIQENRFSQDDSLEEQAFRYVGGPAWSTAKRFYRAGQDARAGNYVRAIEGTVPQGITNLVTVFRQRFLEDGMKTRRGDVILEDVTWGEDFAKIIGFPSTRYTFQQDFARVEKGMQKAIKEKKSKLQKRYFVAERFGDWDELSKVVDEMDEFNIKHPSVAITLESLERSLKSHERTSGVMQGGVLYNPKLEEERQRRLDEYKK